MVCSDNEPVRCSPLFKEVLYMGFMDSVKGFAGKVGDTFEKSAKSVSDSSKKMAERSKVKREITQLETEINNAYITIGKKYVELHSAEPGSEFAEAVNDVITKTDRIEKFKLLLASMDDKQSCSNCGAEVLKGQKFCDKCGAKVEIAEPPIIPGYNDAAAIAANAAESAPAAEAPVKQDTANKFCAKCGAVLEVGQNFCDKCGTKAE